MRLLSGSFLSVVLFSSYFPAAPLLEWSDVFPAGMDRITLHRIPSIVGTPKSTMLAYCEAREVTSADRGQIEINFSPRPDRGRLWSAQQPIAECGLRLMRQHDTPDEKNNDNGRPEQQTVNNPMLIAARDGAVPFAFWVESMRAFYARGSDFKSPPDHQRSPHGVL